MEPENNQNLNVNPQVPGGEQPIQNTNPQVTPVEEIIPSIEPIPSVQSTVVEPQPITSVQSTVVEPQPIPSVQSTVVEPQPAPSVQNTVVEPQPIPSVQSTVVEPQPAPTTEGVTAEQQKPAEVEPTVNAQKVNEEPPKAKKKGNLSIVVTLLVLIVAGLLAYVFLFMNKGDNKSSSSINSNTKSSEYRMSGNSLEAFDLYFLKLENKNVNKIYSPLSIKYALEMLAEGADGNSKAQLDAIIGDYKAKKYTNSKNMSFANALFIRDTFKDSIKEEYTNLLLNKYNAEVKVDSFTNANTINSWIKDKTLGLIDGLVDDETISQLDFALINALAIDMEWKKVIQPVSDSWHVHYDHENYYAGVSSLNTIGYRTLEFDVDKSAKAVDVGASINNYDIINEVGEAEIRKTVDEAYRQYMKENPEGMGYYVKKAYKEYTQEEIDSEINQYLDDYIKEINTGYKQYDSSTDFELYVDDDVKVFAKDLKEYNGTTLQYVGIMPKTEKLDSYINNLDASKITTIINGLKDITPGNFEEGVITKITGFIPLFKFEYKLDLMGDLNKLGITDVFDSDKSNLSKITSNAYISSAVHKANIEFSNEGIKASAATMMGGAGASMEGFEYLYEVPVKEIDLTFDKPYMFIIRDKNTGEVWFTGTVYEPIEWSQELENQEQQQFYQN